MVDQKFVVPGGGGIKTAFALALFHSRHLDLVKNFRRGCERGADRKRGPRRRVGGGRERNEEWTRVLGVARRESGDHLPGEDGIGGGIHHENQVGGQTAVRRGVPVHFGID